MSLISKLLTATLIASVSLSAAVLTEKELVKYVKRHVVKNPSVKVNSVKIVETKQIPELKGWDVLLTNLSINVEGKDIDIPEMMFVNGDLITPVLMNHKNGKNYRNEIHPIVPSDYYDDAHLLMGDKDAKHKILVFSDPQCPFCQELVSDIFKTFKANPSTFALYYYHMPLLRLHPVSDALTKAMHIAQSQGKIAEFEKFYAMKIDYKETNLDKIIPEIKKQTGLEVTKAQLEDKNLTTAIEFDTQRANKLMITGTPTIYIDGEWDKNRDGYKKFIPTK
jgi:protein-disulfide isomerase